MSHKTFFVGGRGGVRVVGETTDKILLWALHTFSHKRRYHFEHAMSPIDYQMIFIIVIKSPFPPALLANSLEKFK